MSWLPLTAYLRLYLALGTANAPREIAGTVGRLQTLEARLRQMHAAFD